MNFFTCPELYASPCTFVTFCLNLAFDIHDFGDPTAAAGAGPAEETGGARLHTRVKRLDLRYCEWSSSTIASEESI